jgi:hypothetical protein
MFNLKKLIEAIAKSAPSSTCEELGQFIADKVQQCDDIRNRILQNKKKQQQEDDRHSATEQALKVELMRIQKECPHYLTTYYPDASGGNDSSTCCDVCGGEI